MSAYVRPRDISIGTGDTWNFSNLHSKDEVMGDDASHEYVLAPPHRSPQKHVSRATPRPEGLLADDYQTGPLRSQTPRLPNTFVERLQTGNMRPHTPRPTVQSYDNPREGSGPGDLRSYAVQESIPHMSSARNRARDVSYQRAISLHPNLLSHQQSNKNTFGTPEPHNRHSMRPPSTPLSALPTANMRKRPGSPVTEPVNKRHQISSINGHRNIINSNRVGSVDRFYSEPKVNRSYAVSKGYPDVQRQLESYRHQPNLNEPQSRIQSEDPLGNPRMSMMHPERFLSGNIQSSQNFASQDRHGPSTASRQDTFGPREPRQHATTPGPGLLMAHHQEDEELMTSGYTSTDYDSRSSKPSRKKQYEQYGPSYIPKSGALAGTITPEMRRPAAYTTNLQDTRLGLDKPDNPKTPPNMSRRRQEFEKGKTSASKSQHDGHTNQNLEKTSVSQQEISEMIANTPEMLGFRNLLSPNGPQSASVSYKLPHGHQKDDSSDIEESTPLVQALARKRQENAAIARQKGSKTDHASNDKYSQNREWPKSQASRNNVAPSHNEIQQSGQADTEVVDLITPVAKPVQRSTPMKQRLTPARKTAAKKEKANTKSPRAKRAQIVSIDLMSPEATAPEKRTPKKQKAKNAEVQEDPESVRQKTAADGIVNKENEAARKENDMLLFGEADIESEEVKATRLQNEQKLKDDKRLELLLANEQARARENERQERLQEEETARQKLEVEKQKAKQIRLEKQRQKDSDAENLRIEDKRLSAIAKIEAERKKTADDLAEKERLGNEEARKAAETKKAAANVAILKAQQEAAKRQASSLTAAKKTQANQTVETESGVQSSALVLAPAGTNDNEDILMEDPEEEEDDLFVSDKPSKPETSIAQLPATGIVTSSVFTTSSQATLAALRKGVQDQGNGQEESVRKTKTTFKRKPIAKVVPKSSRVPKSAALVTQSDDEDEDEEGEEFAFSKKRATIRKPETMLVVRENTAEVTEDEEDPFTWVTGNEIGRGARPSVANSSQSQPNSTSFSRTVFSSKNTTQEADDENLQPTSPAFQARLRQISKQSQARRNGRIAAPPLTQPTATKNVRGRTQAQERALLKAKEERSRIAAEKQRKVIVAAAQKHGISKSDDEVTAEVDFFMEQRARKLEQLNAKTSGGASQALRRKTGSDGATRRAAKSNKHAGPQTLVQNTQNENLLEVESDEDESDDNGLENALNAEFELSEGEGEVEPEAEAEDDNQADQSEAESNLEDGESEIGGSRRSSIAYNSTTKNPIPLPTVLPLAKTPTPSVSSSTKPQRKKTSHLPSRLPRDILDKLPTRSAANTSANMPASSHPQELLLVKIYQVKTLRTDAGSTREFLLDNYGVLRDANARVMLELTKLVNEAIQIESTSSGMNELGHKQFTAVLSAEKGDSVDVFIKEETRLTDTLSGFDPEVFEVKTGGTVWAVIQHLRKQDVQEIVDLIGSREEVMVDENTMDSLETTEDEHAAAADDQLMEEFAAPANRDNEVEASARSDKNSDTTEQGDKPITPAGEDKEIVENSEIAGDALESLFSAKKPATEVQPDEEAAPKVVPEFIPFASRRALNSPSLPHSSVYSSSSSNSPSRSPSPAPQLEASPEPEVVEISEVSPQPSTPPETTLLGIYTSLPMANNFAAEALIKATKPPGFKMSDVEMHQDLIKQVRASRDAHNEGVTACLGVELENDARQLPWCKWTSLFIFVERQDLTGPRNI